MSPRGKILGLSTSVFFILLVTCLEPGSQGDLGQGRFVYECIDETDSYCNPSSFDWSEPIPEAIATGASFVVEFQRDGLYSATQVFSASPAMLKQQDDGFVALLPGRVAILARENGKVVDFYHLLIEDPTQVKVDLVSDSRVLQEWIQFLDLQPGERVQLRASLLGGSGTLAGAVDCQWIIEDDAVASFEPSSGNRSTELLAVGPGTTECRVIMGTTSARFTLTVASSNEKTDGDAP